MSDAIADRLALADVMTRYASTVDRRDLDRYATCFTHNVVVTGYRAGPINGLDAFMDYVRTALSRFRATHHHISNIDVVEIDGDRAHMRSYVQAMHELAAEPDTLLGLWAIYDDRLVRTGDGWRITDHHLERLIPPRRIHAPLA